MVVACISLTVDVEHLFMDLLAICMSMQFLCPFKNQVVFFFAIELYGFLVYFRY